MLAAPMSTGVNSTVSSPAAAARTVDKKPVPPPWASSPRRSLTRLAPMVRAAAEVNPLITGTVRKLTRAPSRRTPTATRTIAGQHRKRGGERDVAPLIPRRERPDSRRDEQRVDGRRSHR